MKNQLIVPDSLIGFLNFPSPSFFRAQPFKCPRPRLALLRSQVSSELSLWLIRFTCSLLGDTRIQGPSANRFSVLYACNVSCRCEFDLSDQIRITAHG